MARNSTNSSRLTSLKFTQKGRLRQSLPCRAVRQSSCPAPDRFSLFTARTRSRPAHIGPSTAHPARLIRFGGAIESRKILACRSYGPLASLVVQTVAFKSAWIENGSKINRVDRTPLPPTVHPLTSTHVYSCHASALSAAQGSSQAPVIPPLLPSGRLAMPQT